MSDDLRAELDELRASVLKYTELQQAQMKEMLELVQLVRATLELQAKICESKHRNNNE